MNAVQNVAFEKSIKTLNALGAEYIISLPNGDEITNIKRMEDKHEERRTTKPRRAPKHNWNAQFNHARRLRSLKVGETDTYSLSGLRAAKKELAVKSITNYAFRVLGKGNYAQHVDGSVLHVMRVA